VGQYVAAWLSSGFATVLELPESVDRARFRAWLLGWLRQRLASAPTAEQSAPVSFLYVVLARLPSEDQDTAMPTEGAVAEFGYGTEPRAPSEWNTVTLSQLLRKVAGDLEG
jgi:hypothetical protein